MKEKDEGLYEVLTMQENNIIVFVLAQKNINTNMSARLKTETHHGN